MPISVSLWNDLSDPVFDGVGLASFKSRDQGFPVGLICFFFLFPIFHFFPSVGLCGSEVFGLIEYSPSLPTLPG